MANCVMCGAFIPDDQGSSSCSMCYGDVDHGKDGYYRRELEQERHEQEQREYDEQQLEERQREEAKPARPTNPSEGK